MLAACLHECFRRCNFLIIAHSPDFFLHTHSYIMIFFKCIFRKARYSVFVSMTNRSNLSARLKSKTEMSSTYHVDWCYIKLQFVWIQLLARKIWNVLFIFFVFNIFLQKWVISKLTWKVLHFLLLLLLRVYCDSYKSSLAS